MDVDIKYDLLKECSLFKDCDEKMLYSIANDTYYRTYDKGEILLTGDSTIHKISIIVNKGRMKIFTVNDISSEEYTVYVLSHGDIFNLITYLDEKKDNLSAMAIDHLDILHCNIDIARSWIQEHSAYNKNLLKYLAQRLRLAIEYNTSKTFYNIELRLAKLIYDNVTNDEGKLNLINDIPHNEIAKMIGTTRTVVNRNLQKLKKAGFIDIKYKQILIKDHESLKEMITDSVEF